MIRHGLFCVLLGLGLILVGCTKSSEPQRAETAKQGLMPAEEPGFDAVYVMDQKDLKLAGPRQVSYDSLDTFRAAAAAKAKEQEVEQAPKAERAAAASGEEAAPVDKAAAGKAPSGKKSNLFKRMKSSVLGKVAPVSGLVPGGGRAPAGGAPGASGKPPAKPSEAKPAEKDKEKAEEEEEAGDE